MNILQTDTCHRARVLDMTELMQVRHVLVWVGHVLMWVGHFG